MLVRLLFKIRGINHIGHQRQKHDSWQGRFSKNNHISAELNYPRGTELEDRNIKNVIVQKQQRSISSERKALLI